MMSKENRDKNTGLKVLSVVFAVLLWLYVIGEGQDPTRHTEKEVNLKYYNLAEGFTAEGPDTVKVKTWGTEKENGDVEVYIDLNGLKEGQYKLPVKVKTLKGALLTAVEPKEVEVTIKRINEHTFRIKPHMTGSLPSGYELWGLEISPDTCLVKGEEKAVKRIKEVWCEIDLAQVKGTAVMEAPLKMVDERGAEVKGDLRIIPSKTTVYLVSGDMLKNKEVGVNVIFEGIPEDKHELGVVSIIPDKITVLGNPSIIEGLQKADTLPISLEGRNASFSQRVKLVLPDKVRAYPDEVLVNVEIKKKENE